MAKIEGQDDVWLSTNPGTTLCNERLERVNAILGWWKFRRLSILGKVAVLKSLVAAQLVYNILSCLESNYKILKEMNSIFFKNFFLWSDKGDKIKRHNIINDYLEGGIKTIDIFSFNKSLKATWIKKYLDANNKGSWKTFFDLEFHQCGGDLILYGNLHKSDILIMYNYISCPFVKEILEIWSDLFSTKR